MRICAGFLILLAAAIVSAAPATQPLPSTQPTTEPSAEVKHAVNQAFAGNPGAAVAELKAIDQSIAKGSTVVDPKRADVLEGLGLAYMLQGNIVAATPCFERIAKLKAGDRDFSLNFARLDLSVHGIPLRAAHTLQSYLNGSQSPDEDALNLFGASLDQASKTGIAGSRMDALADDYLRLNTLLEATRPRMHHWGTAWQTDQQYAATQEQIRLSKDALTRATNYENTIEAADKSAKAQAQNTQRSKQIGGTFDTSSSAGARSGYYTDLDRSNALSNLQRAQASMPHANWSVALAPVMPNEFREATAPAPIAVNSAAPTPAAPEDFMPLIDGLPATLRPPAGNPWSDIGLALANKWTTEHIKGKNVSVSTRYGVGNIVAGSVKVTGIGLQSATKSGLVIYQVNLTSVIAPDHADRAVQLIHGNLFGVTGRVIDLRLTQSSQDPQALEVTISLSEGEIDPAAAVTAGK